MKIALVTKGFSLSRGGVERTSVSLVEALKKAGHDVTVYAGRVDNGGDALMWGVKKVSTLSCIPALRLLSFNGRVRRLIAERGGSGCGVVLGLTKFFPLDIYRAGDGVHRHWMRLRYPNPLVRAIKYASSPANLAMWWLEKNIMCPCNHRLIIANSLLVKKHIRDYFNVGEKDIEVVYNGIDHAVFNSSVKRHRNAVRNRLGISDDLPVGLFISNNWPRKGLDTVLEALACVDGVAVIVAGRGKKEKFLRRMKELNLNEERVIFAGPTEKVEEFYGASDFFVLPTQYDPLSNACLEAMACGLPVVTTATNGACEFIKHGFNGFTLEDWKDSRGLADILTRLKDVLAREAMGERASEAVKEFTWERTAKEIADACFTVIGQR